MVNWLIKILALLSGAVHAAGIPSDSKSNAGKGFTQANCDKSHKLYVETLPGFIPTAAQKWPCSYAGHLSSSPTNDSHKLFFWLYPANEKAGEDAPLIVWLNGGPGASSFLANFLFSGPLRIARDSDKPVGEQYELYTVAENWTNVGSVVYLD